MARHHPAIALLALVLTSGCGSATDGTRTTGVSSTPSVSTVIRFDGDGLAVRRPGDAAKLADAPEDFRQFIAGRIDAVVESGEEGCPPPAITVDVYDPKGFASGSFTSCGGYAIIWKKENGIWQEILGGQDYWPCADLRKHDVPRSVVFDGKCFDLDGEQQVIRYTG